MSKKRFLLVTLLSLALMFTIFAGCNNKTSEPSQSSGPVIESQESSIQSSPESEESEPASESVFESESESESEKEGE